MLHIFESRILRMISNNGIWTRYNNELYMLYSLLYNGYRVFSGVRRSWIVTLTPHPLLVPRSKIE